MSYITTRDTIALAATREARLAGFATFLDTLGEDQTQALGENWEGRVLPALQQASAVLDKITFEVTAEDSDTLPDGWTRVKKDSVEQPPPGPMTIVFPSVHTDADETYITGEEFLRRSKERGGTRRRGLKAANALVREQAKIPEALRGKVVFVFDGDVVEDSDGDRKVPVVCWDGDQWVQDWDWLDDDIWFRLGRPVHACPPATAGE